MSASRIATIAGVGILFIVFVWFCCGDSGEGDEKDKDKDKADDAKTPLVDKKVSNNGEIEKGNADANTPLVEKKVSKSTKGSASSVSSM